MKLSKHWPDNKHKKNFREGRKSINLPRIGLTKLPKKHIEVSMDEVRRQALMMSLQGFSPGVQIKSINVPEKPKRKGRPRVTQENSLSLL